MRLVDTDHPFFQAAWRRHALVGVCAIWTGGELLLGNTGWAIFVGGITGYLAWLLILTWKP